MSENVGRVIEILLDKYIINFNNEKVEAVLKGNIKKKNLVYVGDIVKFEKTYDKNVITEVLKRKNSFIRPPVANIDQLVIVLSLDNPKPDYMLLDKQLILCKANNIEPIICINKIDLSKDNLELKKSLKYIATVYSNNSLHNVIYTSTHDKLGIEELKFLLKGKVSAFSGNSGVGKSSITLELLKSLKKEEEIEIGNIGKKSKRGKHTTKSVKLYEIDNESYILDTPGFSSFELYDIEYKELKNYYDEFQNIKCDYDDCMHINEALDVCKVKQKVKAGEFDKERYERYVYIFSKLKELDDKKYK